MFVNLCKNSARNLIKNPDVFFKSEGEELNSPKTFTCFKMESNIFEFETFEFKTFRFLSLEFKTSEFQSNYALEPSVSKDSSFVVINKVQAELALSLVSLNGENVFFCQLCCYGC